MQLDRVKRSLSIEPGEGLRTALLFALLFAGSMVFVMGRTARDALFLTRFPVTWIAYMWVAYGIVSSIVAVGYGSLSSRFARERFVIGFTLAAAASYAVVRVLIGAEIRWAFAFFYVWAEVIANLTIVQAWTITNDLHDPRSAKRLFGLIGAGRIVGMLLSGFVTGAIVRAIGTANLIVVIIGWMLVFVALVRVVAARYPLPGAAPRAVTQAVQPMGTQHKRYAFLISCMLLAAFLALTVGDYQFKAIAKLSYPNTDDLAAYMAGFYAAMGAIAFVFQVFATPLILRGLGVLAGLAVMPIAFLSSTAVLIFAPVLASATALKLSDNGLQYTIHDATMQVLYFAFPASLRQRVRALLDATIKPLGYSLGGVALVFLAPAPIPGESPAQLASRVAQVGFLTLGLGLVWIGLAPLVRKAYVEALRSSLVRRQSDVSDETDLLYDSTVKQVLTEALRSGEPAQIVYAADRLADADPDTLRAELPPLLRHPDPNVRATALRKAAALNVEGAESMARAALQDPEPRVCAAAIESLGSTLQDDAVDDLAPMVHDDGNRARRDAAIVSLVSHAGLEGILLAGSRLQGLVTSEIPAERAAAARILGSIGQQSLARTLRRLMRDPELSVRREAFRAASQCVSASILPELVLALSDRKLARAAGRALENLGPLAVQPLAEALANDATPRGARLFIPHILHQLGGQAALDALLRCIADDDEGVRQKVLASASRLREALRAPSIAPERLRPLIRAEMQDHVALRDGYLAARPWFARPLLDAQIRLELRGHIVRVMRLCELAWSREHVAAARAGILSSDPTRRANALEVLDNVVDREAREAMLDSLGTFAAATAFADDPAVPTEEPPDGVARWVELRVAMPGLYRRAVLFDAIGVRGVQRFAPLAFRFVDSDHAFMREAALIALAACKPVGWSSVMKVHASGDGCPIVREYASYVMQRGSAGLDPEDDMYTTVEKILFLQGVPLFASVNGQDLLPLARAATIVRLPRGAAVFHSGDPGDSLYVVVHGKVAMTDPEGEVALLGEGEVFGEMAILDEEPRMLSAVVREDADLLRVSAEDFRNALEDTPEVATGVIRVLSQRLRNTGDRSQVLTTDDTGRKTVI